MNDSLHDSSTNSSSEVLASITAGELHAAQTLAQQEAAARDAREGRPVACYVPPGAEAPEGFVQLDEMRGRIPRRERRRIQAETVRSFRKSQGLRAAKSMRGKRQRSCDAFRIVEQLTFK